MYPQGEAAKSNKPPFIDLDDLPAFETVCAAAGGYRERVEDPQQPPGAPKRALETIDRGQQALINVIQRGGAGGGTRAPAAQDAGKPGRDRGKEP
jgi:acetolactate synthase-1/2/3 large subunit